MRKNSCSYPVEFISDAFGEDSRLVELFPGSPRILLVADQNVAQRIEGLGSKIGRYVQAHGLTLAGSPVLLSGGEKIKCDHLQSAIQVAQSLLEAKLGAGDFVLALGGGSVLDIAGYAAAQVRGGVKIVRVPTTPAAMIEAAFAAFAAVDSSAIKDALCVPSEPAAVVIDTTLAMSVLDGVWRSGLGELTRLAIATDAAFLKKVLSSAEDYAARNAETFAELVEAAWKVRAKKGGSDLALWAANRLEAMSGYKLPHGYAVSIALLIELHAAACNGKLKEEEVLRIAGALKASGLIEGLTHSQHLLQNEESLLCGLDAWILSHPEGVPGLAGVGKIACEMAPDRERYRLALEKVRAYSASR